ncbi:MAG: tRNA dihydrouridine synthase DusB [Sphaerochaetaceae bacterium]
MNKKNLYHPLKIGSLELKGNLFLAPLAGYSDKSFRYFCIENQANLCYTEMVSSEALYRNQSKTLCLLERAENEKTLAFQIFGNNPEILGEVLKAVKPYKPDLIDINCGCPVTKVVKTGSGSSLLLHPETIYKMVKELKNNTDLPVTVKIRSGWDQNSINFLETGQAAQEAGCDAICLHPRTKSQMYSGSSDWSHLKILKEKMNVPILGSGDLFSPEDAQKMLFDTKIDGVLFARGAIGNPFIFNQTKDLLTNGEYSLIPLRQKIEMLIKHLQLTAKNTNEKMACKLLRKHVGFYLKGISNSSTVKQELVKAETINDYLKALDKLDLDGDSFSN